MKVTGGTRHAKASHRRHHRVVACGACAIAGGSFDGSTHVSTGLDSLLPVDLYIPGCPPHPVTILDGLLRLQGRIR